MADVVDFPAPEMRIFSCPECDTAFWIIRTDWVVECALCGYAVKAAELDE